MGHDVYAGIGSSCFLAACLVQLGRNYWHVAAHSNAGRYCFRSLAMEKSRSASAAEREIGKELKMIISNLIGGLGNQMFQYAAGRALSLERGTPLRLDISHFANYELHQGFELNRVFSCTADIANEKDVRTTLGWQSISGVRRVVSRSSMSVLRHKAFVIEPHFHYWPEIKNVPSDCYLMGYWQSEQYFLAAASQIRAEFSFRQPLSPRNIELAGQMDQTNAISLHVRRGDYVDNSKNLKTYELCSLDYYSASIRHIAERVENPNFFIFSDDIDWAKKNLIIDFSHQYISHNQGAESYNDMRLMSCCKHHIIANSSFSWWGAWLNASADKLVIAPKIWFRNQTNVTDLLPTEWIKL